MRQDEDNAKRCDEQGHREQERPADTVVPGADAFAALTRMRGD